MNNDITQNFKLAMRRLTSTVTVLTCAADGQKFGMTATAVTSVCADPASLLVCVNQSASFHAPMTKSGRFCVNLLKVGQENISSAFGGAKKGEDRFGEGEWMMTDSGIPYLANAQASIVCTTAETLAIGTHTIFVGTVEHIVLASDVSPLLYQDGGFARAQSLAMPH